MGLAELVAWGMFTVLIGWIGVVLWATWTQVSTEVREVSGEGGAGLTDADRGADALRARESTPAARR